MLVVIVAVVVVIVALAVEVVRLLVLVVEELRVVAATLAARSVLGLNLGTPEPLVPPMLVAPNIHNSTSPGRGTSPIAPSGL